MTTPLVSVVIPCHNQAAFLEEAVNSCLQQDYPQLEVVVVNDGSTDGSPAIAAAYGQSIVYIEQANRGVAAARNAGVKAASGDFIAFLDGDDVALPDRLLSQAEYLSQHGDIGMVAGDALIYDGRQELDALSTRTGKPRNLQDFRWETVDFCPYPSTCMVRRTCFEAIGGFDERFRRSGGEDWLFAVQLALVGGLAYLDQPMARYRVHGGNVTNNTSLVHAQNRLAARAAVEWERFAEYPSAMQARLLYFYFACSWHSEPKSRAMHHLWAALCADPRQWQYGACVLYRGLTAATQRRLSGASNMTDQ